MSFVFKEKLTKVPDEVTVYELGILDSSNEMLTHIAQKFGLEQKYVYFCSSPDWNSYREGQHTIQIHKRSGELIYRDQENYGLQKDKKWKLPDARAKEIANRFTRKLNFLQENKLNFKKVTHLKGAVSSVKNKSIKEYIIDAGVIFGRSVDNIPIVGTGGNCMVNIDYDGQIVGLTNLMRPIKSKLGIVKINPIETAIEKIESVIKRFKGNITVTKSRFGYFELGGYDFQRTLQPAFIFIYTAEFKEVAKKFITVFPASSKVYEPLELGKRFSYKQNPRKK